VSQEMLEGTLPETTALLTEGHYIYRLSFDMQGQVMSYELHREITDEGAHWHIKDYSVGEPGGSTDESSVLKQSFLPHTRALTDW